MSDYLTNLLARSFAVEPAIRPRLVSLYEPSPIDMSLFENEVESERSASRRDNVRIEVVDSLSSPLPLQERTRVRVSSEPIVPLTSSEPTRFDNFSPDVDSPAAREAPQRSVQPSASLPREDHQAAPAEQTRVVAERIEAASKHRDFASRELPSATAPSSPTQQVEHTTPVLVKTNLEESRQSSEETFVSRRTPVQPSSIETNRPPPDLSAPLALLIPVEQSSAPARPHVSAEKAEAPNKSATPVTRVEREVETRNVVTHFSPNGTQAPRVSPANVVHPISVAPAPRIDKDKNAERTIASEPTIQVTIGRVEVRTVVADEGRRNQSSKQSRLMSLDDYLRQRAQGAKP